MVKSNSAILNDLKTKFDGRISKTYLYDPNVCVSPIDKTKPWVILEQPGDFFRCELKATIAGHKVKLRSNKRFIVAEASVRFSGCSSINRKDIVMGLSKKDITIPGFPSLPVWSNQSKNELMHLLNSKALGKALAKLQLKDQESVHIYKNLIMVYLQRTSSKEILSAIMAMCDLAHCISDTVKTDRNDFETSVLPVQFKDLIKLFPKWAESDDVKRGEIIESASTLSLKKLVSTVEPKLQAINEYLDSFKNSPPSEAATALGTLAECCLEAQTELRGRARKK